MTRKKVNCRGYHTKTTTDRDRTIGFMGDEGRVYSTPSMVRDIEYTCHELLNEHLEDGENSVGTHVSVDHIGATVEGDEVEVFTITRLRGGLSHLKQP